MDSIKSLYIKKENQQMVKDFIKQMNSKKMNFSEGICLLIQEYIKNKKE